MKKVNTFFLLFLISSLLFGPVFLLETHPYLIYYSLLYKANFLSHLIGERNILTVVKFLSNIEPYQWFVKIIAYALYFYKIRDIITDALYNKKNLLLFFLLLLFTLEILPISFYKYLKYPLLIFIPVFFSRTFRINNPTVAKKEALILKGWQSQLIINEPEGGILVLGAPGSGKTRFAMEPIIYESIAAGKAGIIYDYDFNLMVDKNRSLTTVAYNAWKKYKKSRSKFFHVNFLNPAYSHRVNPISPIIIKKRSLLTQIVTVFSQNLFAKSGGKDSFWTQSAQVLLEAVIIALSNRYPKFCTLPHAISIICRGGKKLVAFIRKDEEATKKADSILESHQEAPETFRGILTNLQVSLAKLQEESAFWVLSEDEVPLQINNADQPSILCLGNIPKERDTFSPLISAILWASFSHMLQHTGQKSFIAIDEMPTLFLPSFDTIPATVRKYGISTICSLQSNAQLDNVYGAKEASSIRECLKNRLITLCRDHSADWSSKLMGTWEDKKGRQKPVFPQTYIEKMKPSEFFGQVSGSNKAQFQVYLKNVEEIDEDMQLDRLLHLPYPPLDANLTANFQKIEQEATVLVE